MTFPDPSVSAFSGEAPDGQQENVRYRRMPSGSQRAEIELAGHGWLRGADPRARCRTKRRYVACLVLDRSSPDALRREIVAPLSLHSSRTPFGRDRVVGCVLDGWLLCLDGVQPSEVDLRGRGHSAIPQPNFARENEFVHVIGTRGIGGEFDHVGH